MDDLIRRIRSYYKCFEATGDQSSILADLLKSAALELERLSSVSYIDGDLISRDVAMRTYQDVCYGIGCDECKAKETDGTCRLEKWVRTLSTVQSSINATHRRIFQEIVVEYPSINTYPEFKGKPYFSIKYTENGQEFIGYGTYKPEVLSEYLKEYFMSSAQPDVFDKNVGDTIFRQMAIDAICTEGTRLERNGTVAMAEIKQWCVDILKALPSSQLDTCEGCKHLGKWDNEVECGYLSPCTGCKRRANDGYAK